ncbi:MAG: histidine phosphotransferase family protein [Novosphingobium sp.]
MTAASLDLASLLCSRLCHDLLSPVGAMSNGLELLAEESDPEMRKRCMELLEQSARTSADKLKFFRLAFGAAGGFGENVPWKSRALVDALVANNGRSRSTGAGAAMLPKNAVKVLLNLALIGIEALERGGTLDIGAEQREGASEIVVRAGGSENRSIRWSARRSTEPGGGRSFQPHRARGDDPEAGRGGWRR